LSTPRMARQNFRMPPSEFGGPPATQPAPRAPVVQDVPVDLVVPEHGARKLQINDGMLKSVLPTTVLTGRTNVPASVTGDWFVSALMAAALGETDALGRSAAGTWTIRFRSTHPVSVARHKIETLK